MDVHVFKNKTTLKKYSFHQKSWNIHETDTTFIFRNVHHICKVKQWLYIFINESTFVCVYTRHIKGYDYGKHKT